VFINTRDKKSIYAPHKTAKLVPPPDLVEIFLGTTHAGGGGAFKHPGVRAAGVLPYKSDACDRGKKRSRAGLAGHSAVGKGGSA